MIAGQPGFPSSPREATCSGLDCVGNQCLWLVLPPTPPPPRSAAAVDAPLAQLPEPRRGQIPSGPGYWFWGFGAEEGTILPEGPKSLLEGSLWQSTGSVSTELLWPWP